MTDKPKLTFVTGNKEKIADINKMLADKYSLTFVDKLDLVEIQTLSVEKVVSHKVKQAFSLLGEAVVVSDSGLEISALNNFPGALVKFVNETIGQEGLVKLLEEKTNRQAFFVAAIAYCDKDHGVKVFVERDMGTISLEPRGTGWHFDRIFIPKGETLTWAEIGREKKNRNSAFKRALAQLSSWLNK